MERFAFALWSFFLLLMWFATTLGLERTERLCSLNSPDKSSVLILPLVINGVIVLCLGGGLLKAWWDKA